MVAGLEFAVEQFHGQRVEQMFLDGALERARAELRVVAFLGQKVLGGGGPGPGSVAAGPGVFPSAAIGFPRWRQAAFRRGCGR